MADTAWPVLIGVVALLLVVDLIVVRRRGEAPSLRMAAWRSGAWLAIGLAVGAVLLATNGAADATSYTTGFLVEKSLSVDNVAAFAVLLGALGVPSAHEARVLAWGIALALVLRAVLIAVGAGLLARFSWTVIAFGALLVLTAARMARRHDHEPAADESAAVRVLRRAVPVSERLDGERFTTRVDGRRVATPLLAALVLIGVLDVVFAVDSVPAVFAVTTDPFLVFAANAFALLGLRPLYTLLAGSLARFALLQPALAVVLAWIGAKMLASPWLHVPPLVSLGVVVGTIGGAVGLDVLRARRRPLVGAG